MYKRLIFVLLVGIVVVMPLSSANASEIVRSQSEMIQWDPDKAYNGYNTILAAGNAYLIDMEGYVVNTWEPVDTGLGGYFFALENGRWRTAPAPSYAPGGVLRAGGVRGRLEEYTWDGTRYWWWDGFDGVVSDGEGGYEADLTQATFRFHHDWQMMYNSAIDQWTYLVLMWVSKGEADADNIGVDPALNGPSRADDSEATWSPCALFEVRPLYNVQDNTPLENDSAEIIWYWTFADHMVTTDPGDTAMATSWTDWSGRISMPATEVATTADLANYPELLDVNGIHYTEDDGPRPDYQHCNSIDYDETTGHIAINAKAANEFFVIDHDGTFVQGATPGTFANGWDTNEVGANARGPNGHFLYRFGNPANYEAGRPAGFFDVGDMEMYGTHDIQWIMDYHWRPPMATGDNWAAPTAEFANPGGGTDYANGIGNFLMFDNGCYNPTLVGSIILEVNPYIDDRDAYDIDPDDVSADYVDPGPYQAPGLARRDQVVWEYGGGRNGMYDFYSLYISGQTRMPNGNTIICSGANGHLIEVEAGASGGYNANDIVWEYIVPQEDDGTFRTYYQGTGPGQFRFYRFASSHPALVGKDLRRGNTLTGTVPGTSGDVYLPAPTGWGTGNKVGAGGGGGSAAGGGGTGGY